ncbi:LTA synthase family protein [Trueperella pyogenes]|uniref:LTA synthase family protein n=1 Tax=Trueperella pyogenes TaxID=1661 RepID=UPI00215D59AF|nr:LTA synthase family protein [Trueperella pyogenes]UVJ59576.1 LTA synthase family protein [Trueperella pyogenes]
MAVFIHALSVIALMAVSVLLFGRNGASLARGFAVGIIVNAAAFFVATYAYGGVFVYGTEFTPYLWLLSGLALGAGVAILVALSFAYRHILARKPARWRLHQILPVLFGALIAALAAFLFFIPKKITDSLDEVTADEILFILYQGNGETTPERALEFTNHMVAPVIWAALVGACIGLIRSDIVLRQNTPDVVQGSDSTLPAAQPTTPARFRFVRGLAMLAMLATLAGSVTYAFRVLPLTDIWKGRFETSLYIGENFVLPTNANVTLPEKKRNLVHIYMESIENSFYSKDLGGYTDYNIMPELAELTKKGVSFSHTDKMGGPQQLTAMGHSVAAMVAMNAGVPMLAPGDGNGTLMSYPNFRTTGDYLHDAGYATDFMLGSNSQWAGLGDYYRRHGNFTVHDIQTFKAEGRIPEDYYVWWGVEDDKLYEYAKDVLTKRASGDKPFYFILENADTHFPGGLVSPNTEMIFPQQYENVIHYSQAQTVKLVEWMLAQPWAKDTTIVITGDHRSMDREFFADWDKSYNRTIVNTILNPVQGTDLPTSITQNRQYATFDFYPTILSAIGATIEGDRLGLGTNLFSGTPTLVERDGADLLNEEFRKRSLFYDEHRETVAEKPGVDE